MPVYFFKCKVCGHEFEVMATIEDRHKKVKCPKCGKYGYKIFTPISYIDRVSLDIKTKG